MSASAPGLSFSRLRQNVRRDSFSDFLPLVTWEPESEAFLCIDDSWGHAWEIVPSAYMFAHVQAALQGLLNIQFPDGTVLQFHTFADPLIDGVLDAYLDLKTRDDPLIQASARRTHQYLSEGRHGLKALHDIPVRDFRTLLSIKTRRPLGEDLRRQVEEQLSKLGIRRLPPEAMVAFYRRIFNGVAARAPGVFADGSTMGAPPIAKQIIDAGPDLVFEGSEVFLGNQVARCLTPKAPARRITAERANRLMGGMRGSSEDSDQIGGPFLYTLNVLFDHSQFEIHKRAQILSAENGGAIFGHASGGIVPLRAA